MSDGQRPEVSAQVKRDVQSLKLVDVSKPLTVFRGF